jgi:hypothetical protein
MAQSLHQIVLFRVLQGLFGVVLADRAVQHQLEGMAGIGDGAVGSSRP